MSEIYKYDYKQYQLLCFTFLSKLLIDLEICFDVGITIEFLLNFFHILTMLYHHFF